MMNENLLKIREMVNPKTQDEKLVFLINGVAESGKDTLIKNINKYTKNIHVHNRSTIDIFKNTAEKIFGWNGEKTYDAREMLHEFKEVFVKYNEFPTLQAVKYYNEFTKEDTDNIADHPTKLKKCEVLFLHIREQEEIEKFKEVIGDRCTVLTLLIKKTKTHKQCEEHGPTLGVDDCKNCYNYSCKFCVNKDPGTEDIDESKYDIIFENNFNRVSDMQFARLIEGEYNKLANKYKKKIFIVLDPYFVLSHNSEFAIKDPKTQFTKGLILNGSRSYFINNEKSVNKIKIDTTKFPVFDESKGFKDISFRLNIDLKEYTRLSLKTYIERSATYYDGLVIGFSDKTEYLEIKQAINKYLKENDIRNIEVRSIIFRDIYFSRIIDTDNEISDIDEYEVMFGLLEEDVDGDIELDDRYEIKDAVERLIYKLFN